MELNQLVNIHTWIRNSQVSEILFISALVLPGYLLMYNYAIIKINESWKGWGLAFAVIIFIAGIIWMKNSQSIVEKNIQDISVIKNYILDKDYRYMSFERLEEMDDRFTEKRVKELLFIFPNEIRLAKLKNNKKGIKVINIEDENT